MRATDAARPPCHALSTRPAPCRHPAACHLCRPSRVRSCSPDPPPRWPPATTRHSSDRATECVVSGHPGRAEQGKSGGKSRHKKVGNELEFPPSIPPQPLKLKLLTNVPRKVRLIALFGTVIRRWDAWPDAPEQGAVAPKPVTRGQREERVTSCGIGPATGPPRCPRPKRDIRKAGRRTWRSPPRPPTAGDCETGSRRAAGPVPG